MENDSIRSSGNDTLVDIWIDGKMRALCVSHEAIGAFIGFDKASAMSDSDRCEFVRTHLPLVISAAKTRLAQAGANPDAVTIDVGQLPRADGRSGDRRMTDRRKDDRRKVKLLRPGQPERRKNDRRQGERRTRPPKPKDS